jgi:alpha-tubulin suppressor-like RCC1 family protein
MIIHKGIFFILIFFYVTMLNWTKGDEVAFKQCLLWFMIAGHRVVDVACGSGDAQTLIVTDAGLVFSWGDGDYGKLGKRAVGNK